MVSARAVVVRKRGGAQSPRTLHDFFGSPTGKGQSAQSASGVKPPAKA